MEAKHKFKSNNVNSIFKQTVMENVEPTRVAGSHTASNSPRDSSSPGPSGVPVTIPLGTGSRQASLSTATGHYKLGMVSKDAAAKQAANGWTATSPAAPKSAETATANGSEQTSATSAPAEEPKKAAHQPTEEELAKKGIFVASRYTSTNDVNWSDDEDDEWQPPTNKSALPTTRPAPSSLGRTGRPPLVPAPKSSAKPKPAPPVAAAGSASAGSSGSGAAWTRKAEPTAMSIKELREQAASGGPGRPAGVPHTVHRPPPVPGQFRSGGGDGLSRFRMGGPANGPPGGFGRGPPPFRGPPGFGGGPGFGGPGGPGGFGGPSGGFGGGPDFGFDDEPSDWRSRRAPGGGPGSGGPVEITPTPHPAHREIPDRFKIGHTAPVARKPEPVRRELPATHPLPRATPKVQPKVEPKVEAKVEAKVEPKVESKVEPKAEASESKDEPKTESKPKVETRAEPQAEKEPKVEQKEAKVEPKEVKPVKTAEEIVAEQKALMRARLEKARLRREAEALADKQREERLAEVRKKELEAIKAKQEEENKRRREALEKRREEAEKQRAEQREREREARERLKEQRRKDDILDKQSWHALKAEAAAGGSPATSRLQPARPARVPRSALPKGPRETHSDDPREKHDPRLASHGDREGSPITAPRDSKFAKESKEFTPREPKELTPREHKEHKEPKEPREPREPREIKEHKESRDSLKKPKRDAKEEPKEFRGVRDFREELKAEGPPVTINLPKAESPIKRPNFNLHAALEKVEAQEVRPAHFASTMMSQDGWNLLFREPKPQYQRVPNVRAIKLPFSKEVVLPKESGPSKGPKAKPRLGRKVLRKPRVFAESVDA